MDAVEAMVKDAYYGIIKRRLRPRLLQRIDRRKASWERHIISFEITGILVIRIESNA